MTTKARVYLETTIPSYLTAWPSRDLVMAANQELTREWWKNRSSDFDLFVSQIVIMECRAGDPVAAQRCLEFLNPFPRLDITAEAEALAARLIAEVPLPSKAQADALHIAEASVNNMNYLLTWNCTHIANATLRTRIEQICRLQGYEPAIVCTPQEMLEQGD
jgi:predicted nucleic acid-binding protein